MNDELMLNMLKVDLGISTSAYDARLTQYLQTAKDALKREGADISTAKVEDCTMVIMYAGWLWRKRDTGEGMPRMLRWLINNKIFEGTDNG